MVRVIQGKAIKIEGNPLHPINQGRLCPKGQSGLHVLYDPDRIRSPLRRRGERGAGKWEEIGWEEAIGQVSEKLKELRREGAAHSLVVMSGQKRGVGSELLESFTKTFGSPNFIPDDSDYSTFSPSVFLMQGIESRPCYDLLNANYVLSFNSSIIETSWSPVQAMRAYGSLRERRLLKRSKLVHAGPYLSLTAAKADEWIPIAPGTEAALALSMCHVIIREGLLDDRFISKYAFGFDDWRDQEGGRHIGFRTLVLRDYGPGDVSELTGVPTQTIIRLAKEFSMAKPSVAVDEDQAVAQSQNTYAKMAFHALNALSGNIDVPGGVLAPGRPAAFDLPILQPGTRSELSPGIVRAGEEDYPWGSGSLDQLPKKIVKEDPYAARCLFLHHSNPLFYSANSSAFSEAFEKIPFIVSFSPFMDESSQYADLILPDCIYLEKWEDDPAHTLEGFPLLSVRQPAVKPVYDTKNTSDVILLISNKVLNGIASAFPWNDTRELIRHRLNNVFNTARGDVFGENYETIWIRLLENVGWRSVSYSSFDEFFKEVLRKGGWWDPMYYHGEWDRLFKTPSGKFEFFSQKLLARAESGGSGKSVAAGDVACLPHYEPVDPDQGGEEHHFLLNVYPLLTFFGGRNANQPWLKDLSGLKIQEKWDGWVEINPESAKEMGVSAGDWVWVESSFGKLKLKAKLFAGTRPEVVNVPFGFGHTGGGRWAEDEGENINVVTRKEYDSIAGNALWNYTRVRIYKA